MKTKVTWNQEAMQIQNDEGIQVTGSAKPEESGYTPIELMSSSLGLCLFITISRIFERDQLELDLTQLSVTVDAVKAENGPSRIEQFVVDIELPAGLDSSYRKKIILSAEKACTIGNTLQKGAEINIQDLSKE
ncbi:hypothetical protein BUY34_09090 [Staphylococcus cohnii]|uniref:OsmC family peroxiredoxin n=1 Tax=Staphylococcus cohnii TaxID=29382 RepID=A0A2T4LR81_9STAP|nr:OsmC family protein [Staphylococcus cohnii]PTF65852.1 hypothetical protein BUY34_09090 [Staphylococcus cohnii]